MSDLLVLHAVLRSPRAVDAYAALLNRLPYAKRMELERRDDDARLASLAGIALALHGLEILLGRPAEPGELWFPQDGKPRLRGGPSFSISHSGEHVGVALSSAGAVGFDLEKPDRSRLMHWTAVEAVLKAAGRPLRDAASVSLDPSLATGRIDGAVFHVRPIVIDGIVAHAATEQPVTSLTVEEIALSALASRP